MRDVVDELEASLNDTLTFDFDTEEEQQRAANETVPPQDRVTLPPISAHEPPPLVPSAAAVTPLAVTGAVDGPGIWEQVRGARIPRTPLEPIRSGLPRALALLVLLAAAGLAVYLFKPQWLPSGLPLPHAATGTPAGPQVPSPDAATTVEASAGAKVQADHILLEQRITALEARGASIWGGADFAGAKSASAQALGAHDGGSVTLAAQRLAEANRLIDGVEQAAPAALAAELAAGDRALNDAQPALAQQAYDLAVRIAPQDERALAGQARARELTRSPASLAAQKTTVPPGTPAPAPAATPQATPASPPAPPPQAAPVQAAPVQRFLPRRLLHRRRRQPSARTATRRRRGRGSPPWARASSRRPARPSNARAPRVRTVPRRRTASSAWMRRSVRAATARNARGRRMPRRTSAGTMR